jgi:hypothetical protein
MGAKLDEAFHRLQDEARHHTRLALAKQDDYENGFAQGFTEALRIVIAIREGK